MKGVSKVLLAKQASFKGHTAEAITDAVISLQNDLKFTHIVAGATAFGKNVLPRIAAKLDVSPISDIIDVKAQDTFVRTIYAGELNKIFSILRGCLGVILTHFVFRCLYLGFRKCHSNIESQRSG